LFYLLEGRMELCRHQNVPLSLEDSGFIPDALLVSSRAGLKDKRKELAAKRENRNRKTV
jgi:hypothetical protein